MPRRSFWAWGLESDEPTLQERQDAAARLSRQYGLALTAPPAPVEADLVLRAPRITPPAALEPICSTETHDRAVHTYGRSFRDRVRAFNLQFPNPPDVIARPRNEQDVEQVLEWCSQSGYTAIPFGGGSSTVGGFEPTESSDGVVTIDMSAFDKVLEIDEVSRAARIQGGAYGPALEDQLRPHGYTLRHFPQSFEYSTLGGLDRDPFRWPLRHQPHPHRRLRGIGPNGHPIGCLGIQAATGVAGLDPAPTGW